MFRTAVTSTALTTPESDAYFHRITASPWNSDISFKATLRALVYPRMAEDEYLGLEFYSSNFSHTQLSSMSVTDALDRILPDPEYFPSGIIRINNFNHSEADSNTAWFSLIQSEFVNHYEGWYRLDKMTEFYRKSFNVLCYINPEIRSVCIFVESLNLTKLHYLQCSVFAFLPWYFNPVDGVSEIEMELIKSLKEKNSSKYIECLKKFAEKFDFRTEKIRNMLRGFETKYERIECNNLRSHQDAALRQIKHLNDQISEYMKSYNDYSVKILGLEQKIASEEENGTSEIMEYFLANKNLCLEEVNDSSMTFVVNNYLLYFDEEMAESMISNRNSYVYRSSDYTLSSYIPSDDMESLMRAVFIEQTIKIRVCAAYKFNLTGSVRGIQRYDFPSECDTSIPNVHIDEYSCLGSYERIINEMLLKHDHISAIEQCIASCKSLNFADSTVMREFMKEIYGIGRRNSRCFELPNGEVVDAKEAISWLKAALCR